MASLLTLGTLDLRDAEGKPIASVLAQPKRTALLAYLAIARPRGFHRRDTLVGLFWPELDDEHARAALRKSLFQLRASLGKHAFETRGDDDVALSAEVWCDAAALEDAAAAGDFAKAFELYRGPLLNGLFVSDAPEFESWLSNERQRLQQIAFAAASTLAEREERDGNRIAAAYWARQAMTLIPTDEPALRRLVELLDRVDDRAGALAAYEEFAHRLATDFDVQPAAETDALVQRIRARTHAPAATIVAPVAEAVPAAATEAPAPVAPQVRVRPWRTARRRVAIARGVTAAALIVVAVLLGARAIRRAPAAGAAAANTIAVLPFSYSGDAAHRHLGTGFASLLATGLDGAGGLRVVDPHALRAASPRADAETTPQQARETAQQLGAGRYVLGDVVEAGSRLRVTATLYDGRSRILARAATDGTPDDLFDLVDRVAAQLISGQADARGSNIRIAARTTHSLPALKAYLDGETEFRAGRYTTSIAAYQRAVQEDSTFALAHYRLAAAYSWASDTMSGPTARLALRFAGRLATPDRLLLEALVPMLDGRADEAERRYRAILDTYPFEAEAWGPLGEVLFHYNHIRGRSITEARGSFERALSHGPRDAPLTHLIEIAGIEGDYVAFDTLMRAMEHGAHFEFVGRTVVAFTRGSEADRRKILHEIERGTTDEVDKVAGHVVFLLHDRAAAARVLDHIAETQPSRELRALAFIMLAHVEAAAGRVRAADAALARAAQLDPVRALEHRALIHALPFLQLPAAEVAATRAALDALPPANAGRSGILFPQDAALHPLFRTYLRGLHAARAGDAAFAAAIADSLGREVSTPAPASLGSNLAHGIRAQVAWTRGNAAAALLHLDAIDSERDAAALLGFVPFFEQPHERFMRAEALQRTGRIQDALGWYQSFGEHSPFGRVFLAPAHLRQAEIHERLGDRAAAAANYQRFIAMWQHADAALQPEVARARGRLAALGQRER